MQDFYYPKLVLWRGAAVIFSIWDNSHNTSVLMLISILGLLGNSWMIITHETVIGFGRRIPSLSICACWICGIAFLYHAQQYITRYSAFLFGSLMLFLYALCYLNFAVYGMERNVLAGLVQFHMTILHIWRENYQGTMALMLQVWAEILWLSRNTSSIRHFFFLFTTWHNCFAFLIKFRLRCG